MIKTYVSRRRLANREDMPESDLGGQGRLYGSVHPRSENAALGKMFLTEECKTSEDLVSGSQGQHLQWTLKTMSILRPPTNIYL